MPPPAPPASVPPARRIPGASQRWPGAPSPAIRRAMMTTTRMQGWSLWPDAARENVDTRVDDASRHGCSTSTVDLNRVATSVSPRRTAPRCWAAGTRTSWSFLPWASKTGRRPLHLLVAVTAGAEQLIPLLRRTGVSLMNGGIGLALGSLGVVTRARATRMARLLVHQSPEIPHELRYPAVGGFDRGVVAFRVHLLRLISST